MGLLDKVDNIEEKKPTAKKPVKVAPKPKPKPKAKPAPVVAELEAAPEPEEIKIRPTGLPEGYELAGKLPRYIGWLINFGWNFGVLIGTLSVFVFADSDFTIGFGAAGLMIIANWLVVPIWMGRNVGEFVSRTKYINSAGNKPLFIHAILNNSLGFMALIGIILVMANLSEMGQQSGVIGLSIGSLMIILWFVNFFFKKNSDYSQGLFDLLFSAFLVKHVATGDETGWAAKFENLGDFGDKWAAKQEERREKAAKKAEERAKKAAEQEAESENNSENDEESTED